MTIKWRDEFSPSELLNSIDDMSSLDKDGNVTYKDAFGYNEYISVLEEMVDFVNVDNEYVKRELVRKTISDLVKKSVKIDKKTFLSQSSKNLNSYKNRKVKNYYMLGEISIRSTCPMKAKRIHNSSISIKPYIKNKFYSERERVLHDAEYNIIGKTPNWYQSVKVKTPARSIHEGFDTSLSRLDLLRAIWNFYINRSKVNRSSSGVRKPINTIVLGPFNTLHEENGKAATEQYSYEPYYGHPVDAVNINNKIDNIYTFEANVRKHLLKSKYRTQIEEALIQYVRALDNTNWDVSFLKLWNVLEYLTGTEGNDGYNVTVRRASFLYEDREYAKQKLNALRNYRNKAVHTGYSTGNIETYIYLLKRIVESLLQFHLANKFSFYNIKEAAEFLSITSNKKELRNKIKLYNNALFYLNN